MTTYPTPARHRAAVRRLVDVDWDYRSPRGITLREALARLVKRSTRLPSGCLIAPAGPDRYAELTASGTRIGAHVAVVLARGERLTQELVVRHTCDVRGCIESDHLLVGTQSQNLQDCYQRARRTPGTWPVGERRAGAVLSDELVADLRRRARAGEPLSALASTSGHSYSIVRTAVRGETWRHVKEPPVPGRRNKVPNPNAYRLTRASEARRVGRLYASGLSLSEIAHRIGGPRSTAFRLLQAARQLDALARAG